MKINKLSVASFGKFNSKEFELKDGLNVIYGPNESGKSTLISFVRFMLFSSNGRKSQNNVTFGEKYSPWDNTSMSGSIEFESDGSKYISSRSHGVRKEYSSVNLVTGESCFEGVNPGEALYKMNESAFLRSFYLSSSSCAIYADKYDDILKGLSNISETGDESLSYESVKKSITADKKHISEKISVTDSEILSMRKKLERIGQLKEKAENLTSKLNDTNSSIDSIGCALESHIEDNSKYQKMLEKYASARLYQQAKVIIFVLLSVLVCVLAAFSMFMGAVLVCIVDLLTVLLMVTGSKKIKRLKSQLSKFDKSSRVYATTVKNDLKSNDDVKTALLKEIGAIESEIEKEYSYDDICSRIDDLNAEKTQLLKRLDVIERASRILDNAYGELKGLFSPVLNERASEIFAEITGNKYPDIMVADDFSIKVKSDYDYKPSQMFSASTYEMMYFSLRLALCDLLCENHNMPVFLDDCFALCDDKRIKTALEFLNKYAKDGRQVVFCTCHTREKNILNSFEGINLIDLSNI